MTAPGPAGEHAWPVLLSTLVRRDELSSDETAWAMGEVMSGNASPAQIAGFVVALRAKGETAAEMDGLVRAMLEHAHRIDVPGPIVDIVGTGGDRAHTVNISTMAALVVAGTGARVVKHGNRAASSTCGAADVLEELGVNLTLTPDQVAAVAVDAGITFCFAQVFHPGFRHAAVPRRELGIATAFNFLGPLTNPAQPGAQAIGCADARMAAVMAEVFARRGVSALVVRGDDGLDELTTTTTSTVWRVRDGTVTSEVVDPSRLGLATSAPGALRGGDAAFNAAAVRALLAGEPGPVRDAVLLNAAAALVALEADDAVLDDRLAAGLTTAAEAVDSGAAAAVLDHWVAATQAF
ncbi:MAG TPA: anthranilate phosphoribosyltransferase [Actinomycetes bacterium]